MRRERTRADQAPSAAKKLVRAAQLPLAAAIFALGLVAAPACADHLILRSDLRFERGVVVGITAEGVSVWGDDGEIRELRAEECLGLVDPEAALRTDRGLRDGRFDAESLLILSDGQRLPGRPSPRGGALAWEHPSLGEIPVDLESLEALLLAPGASQPRVVDSDVLELINGDRVEGIVESIGAVVSVRQIGAALSSGAPMQVPLERVAAIGLVTPRREGRGVRLWLDDGTVVDAGRPELSPDGQLRAAVPMGADRERTLTVPLAEVRGAAFAPSPLIPLAALPSQAKAPPERLSAPPPVVLDPLAPLGLSPVRLSGPGSFSYALPRAGLRLSGSVRLAADAAPWGDLEVILREGEAERWRGHLDAGVSRLEFELLIGSETLVIELAEGRNGPVQDFVVLEHAVLAPADHDRAGSGAIGR